MAYTQLRTPFDNMTWTPDVPSNQLGPNEYNSGQNVETDTRGVQKVLGEQLILANIPGNVLYTTGGFRTDPASGNAAWTYITICDTGHFYALTAGGIIDITPPIASYTGIPATGGSGANAQFTVEINSNQTYNVLISNEGNGYTIGDTLTIAGANVGGISPINNITVNVANVVSNQFYSNLFPVDVTSTGFGSNINVWANATGYAINNIANAGYYYNIGDVLAIPGANLGGVSGVNDANIVISTVIGNRFWNTVAGQPYGNISGNGTVTFNIWSNIGGYQIANVVSGGNNWQSGQFVYVYGNSVGGTTPANDLYLQVTAVSNSNVITSVSVYTGIANAGGIITANISGLSVAGGITTVTWSGTASNSSMITYTAATNFTDDWAGTTCFINDTIRPPLYLSDNTTLGTAPQLFPYDVPNPSVVQYIDPNTGLTSYTPVWNYAYTDPILGTAQNVTGGFIRVYNSPNLGNILVTGRLKIKWSTGITKIYPTTVRWSQTFSQNGIPYTFQPTLYNVANELEVPVRGDLVDGFQFGGNFYLLSYWDTVVLLPINYTTSQAPNFAIRLFNQGRGLLNPNSWINTDDRVFGVDARDIWSFDGSSFKSIGNQRVKDWFYDNLNNTLSDRLFCVNNTRKNQFEVYFPSNASTEWCDLMISYRYDIDVWNAPRTVANAVHGIEAPEYDATIPGFNASRRIVTYAQGFTPNSQLIQKDIGNSFIGNTNIYSVFERNNIEFPKVAYSMKVFTHRVLPEMIGTGNANIEVGGANSVAQTANYQPLITFPISTTNNPWVQINQNDSRMTSIRVSSNDTDFWKISAVTWLTTIVEDNF